MVDDALVVTFEPAARPAQLAFGAFGATDPPEMLSQLWAACHRIAISLGAVFMGAMTYIGNGPNFMVKSIAEKNNVRMPSFFGYMAYSCAVLFPLSLLLTWVFLV